MFLSAAATCALLSFGLCGTGMRQSVRGSHTNALLFPLGLSCLGLTLIFGVLGVIMLIIESNNSSRR